MRTLAFLLATLATNALAEGKPVLPFIEDDYPRALAEAKARKLPLFVDAWAPWCHSCLALRTQVLNDPALAGEVDRFVWLSVDTEKAQNAGFQGKFPLDAWPTLFVIDPAHETVVLKWLGTANAHDLAGILDDGARALSANTGDGPQKLAAQADAAEGAGRHAEAIKGYRAALAAGGPGWSDRARVLQSLIGALQFSQDSEGCVRLAREQVATLAPGPAYANLVASGLQCALDAPDDAAWKKDAVAQLEPLTQKALEMPGLLGDDVSGLYETLVGAREAAHDDAGKKKLAAAWLAFLEGAAKDARSKSARAAFDPHRVEAAIALGEPARAVPALQQSAADFPDDYNPWARLALVDVEQGKLDQALADNDRALKKVYGPRTLRVLEQRAEILARLHRDAESKETLQRALTFARALPAGQQPERYVARLEKKIAAAK